MKKQNNGLLRQVCSKEDLADIIGVNNEQLVRELAKESRQVIREYVRKLALRAVKSGTADEIVADAEEIIAEAKKAKRKRGSAAGKKNKGRS